MHCSVTWDYEGSHTEINQTMSRCFESYQHVRVFNQTYVVQLLGNGAYESLQKKLLETARSFDTPTVRFLISPLQHRGVYNGRMSEEAAGLVNKLAE